MAIAPDGKIVIVGGNGFGLPNENFALARYNTDGSLDTSFGGDGKVTTSLTGRPDVAFGVALQPDGKIVAAGGVGLGAGNPKFGLARYDTDGSLDASFGGDGTVLTDFTRGDDDAYSVALQADGKIVAAGQSGGRDPKFALARYDTDGALDTGFSANGKLTTNFSPDYDAVYTVLIQSDGKILTDGTSASSGSPSPATSPDQPRAGWKVGGPRERRRQRTASGAPAAPRCPGTWVARASSRRGGTSADRYWSCFRHPDARRWN
jgi:uncharacterized delta-60 repeat protein